MAEPEPRDPRLEWAETVARLFGSEDGRTVRRWWTVNYLMRRSFVAGDPHATSFREGQRDVPLEFEDLIALAADPRRLSAVERFDG